MMEPLSWEIQDPERLRALHEVIEGRVFDLSYGLYDGVAHYPSHPGFALQMHRQHGSRVRGDGSSSASCHFSVGGHTGTHMDAIGHVSADGRIHGGRSVEEVNSDGGLLSGGIEETVPFLGRGLLLDVASAAGSNCLAPGFEVTAELLTHACDVQGIDIPRGSAVLIRTGWGHHWGSDSYVELPAPGPGVAAAEWLLARGVSLVGSDTLTFERGPVTDAAPVHTLLLVENGIPIMESLRLDALGAHKLWRFLLVAVPLAIQGGTGSPIRPLALI